MPDLIPVAKVAEIPVGGRKIVQVGNVPIAVFHLPTGWFAILNVCPHRGGPLGEGPLDGTVVMCPWHSWRFDVTTGKNALNPAAGVLTFEVKVEGDQVLLDPVPREKKGSPG